MKKALTAVFTVVIILALVVSLSGCDLLSSLISKFAAGDYSGVPDSRFTGTWVTESGQEENKDFGSVLIFTEKGTIEFAFAGELDFNIPNIDIGGVIGNGTDGTTSETTEPGDGKNIKIDLSKINSAISALQKLVTITYEVKSDTVVAIEVHTSFDKTSNDEVEYSFDGNVLVFSGTRYIKQVN